MIFGTAWSDERAARVVRIAVPDGYRLLTALETLEPSDLQLAGLDWKILHPANYGRQAGGIVAAARRGSGLTEIWIVPARPEDFLQIAGLDLSALKALAYGGPIVFSPFWICLACGEPYPKGAAHRCGSRPPPS